MGSPHSCTLHPLHEKWWFALLNHLKVIWCALCCFFMYTCAENVWQVSSMEKKGVSAQVINAETLGDAAMQGRNIWVEVKSSRLQILLFSLETTASNEYDNFINDPVARTRIAYFIIDKIHLVYEWGPEFRVIYLLLSTMRARLPKWTVFVGLAATLEPGRET